MTPEILSNPQALRDEQMVILAAMHADDFVTPVTHATTPNNPERVHESLGNVLPYFRDVELLVDQYANELDVATGKDPFRERWAAEEPWHGRTYDAILRASGIDYPLPVTQEPSEKFIWLGRLCRASQWFEGVIANVVARIGHINEATNIIGQQAVIRKLTRIDEHELARTIAAMARQERRHDKFYQLEFYRTAAELGRAGLRLADYLFLHSFTPVGANDPQMKQRFGQVMEFLLEDPDTQYDASTFYQKLHTLTEPLLHFSARSAQSVSSAQAKITNAFENCRQSHLVIS